MASSHASSPSPSPSNSPTFTSSFTSFSTALATFDVSTYGDGPFPKPLIREDSWNRIPLEYRPLTPQPHRRWKKSRHRDVPTEYRSGGVTLRREQQQPVGEGGRNQHGDHYRATLSRSNSGDKPSWLAALVSTVKRPKHNAQREPPPAINVSVSSDRLRTPMTTPPLPPAATTATTTAHLAPPRLSTNPSSGTDSVTWDPTTQVWRRIVPSGSSASSITSSDSHSPAVSFPYSDYTLMTESERLDYFLDHRVASVVDNEEASFTAAAPEGDSEERPPPPPYVQSQWEAVQERRIRRMQTSGRGVRRS
ncbi:MAG: hypothetical protein M1839_000786 [Geoglossum umbratile]|nr:MAG: hypothetical protein M1839_000786 [Geoglossum umbratile]